jgi:hypothetical protein
MSTRNSLARHAALAPIVALVLVMVAGCGSDDSPAKEKDHVRETVNRWEVSLTRGKGDAVCAQLTKAGRDELLLIRGGRGGIPIDASCPLTVRGMFEGTKNIDTKPKPPRVISVRLDGDRATAEVSTGGFRPTPIGLAKQDGEWMISSPGFRSPLPGGPR